MLAAGLPRCAKTALMIWPHPRQPTWMEVVADTEYALSTKRLSYRWTVKKLIERGLVKIARHGGRSYITGEYLNRRYCLTPLGLQVRQALKEMGEDAR